MRKRSTWVAWALLVVWTASVAALVGLSVANGNFQRQPLADTVGLLLALAAFMGVGALIVAHRPGNAIGWVFSAIGLLAATGAMAEEYAGYAVRTRPALLPGGLLAGWYAGWAWYPTAARRHRPGAWSPGWPGPARRRRSRSRPCSPPSSSTTAMWSTTRSGRPGSTTPRAACWTCCSACWSVAAVVSLVVRFRRSRGDERLQLKWFTYAGALLPLILLGDLLPDAVSSVLFAVGISLLPVAAGVAVLRYRLYEIDG